MYVLYYSTTLTLFNKDDTISTVGFLFIQPDYASANQSSDMHYSLNVHIYQLEQPLWSIPNYT